MLLIVQASRAKAYRRPKKCRRVKASLEARGLPQGEALPETNAPIRRRPTIQLQSAGIDVFSKHARLHSYVLLNTAYLSLTLSISYSLCISVSVSASP